MKRTLLANVKGWTPLIDAIVHEHGYVTAAVFGRIWRYCQMENGRCEASQPTIAAELNLDPRTVRDHVAKLVDSEYLHAESRPGKPTLLYDTGKADWSFKLTSAPLQQPGGSPPTPESNSGVPRNENPGTPDSISDEERSKRGSQDTKSGGAPSVNPDDDPFYTLALQFYGFSYDKIPKATRQLIGRALKALQDAQPDLSAVDIREFREWWATEFERINPPHDPTKLQVHFMKFRHAAVDDPYTEFSRE